MTESLYPKHVSAPVDLLSEAMRCQHCGQISPLCGDTVEFMTPRGSMKIVACEMASDLTPITFLGPPRRKPIDFGAPAAAVMR